MTDIPEIIPGLFCPVCCGSMYFTKTRRSAVCVKPDCQKRKRIKQTDVLEDGKVVHKISFVGRMPGAFPRAVKGRVSARAFEAMKEHPMTESEIIRRALDRYLGIDNL